MGQVKSRENRPINIFRMMILSEVNLSSNSDNNNNNNNKIHRKNSRNFDSKTVRFRQTILVQIVPSEEQYKKASHIWDNSRSGLNRLSSNILYENDNDNDNTATSCLMIHRNNKWRGMFNDDNSLGKILQPLINKLSLKLILPRMLSQSPNHSTVHQHIIGTKGRKVRRRSSMLPSYHDKYYSY